jgi:hypothetical protein
MLINSGRIVGLAGDTEHGVPLVRRVDVDQVQGCSCLARYGCFHANTDHIQSLLVAMAALPSSDSGFGIAGRHCRGHIELAAPLAARAVVREVPVGLDIGTGGSCNTDGESGPGGSPRAIGLGSSLHDPTFIKVLVWAPARNGPN